MLGKGLQQKTTALFVFLLWLVKSLKNINNRIVDHLEKCGLFSDFQYGFRSSQSTADLLTVVSDRFAKAFNRSGATQVVALDNPRCLTGFCMLVFFTNLSLMEFQVRYLALLILFSVIDSFEWFWMVNLHKNIQLMLEFLKAPFLVLNVSYYTSMTFLIMSCVILLSMLMILPNSKCDQASDLWQQLELASELESDLQDTMDWGRKWLVDFNARKTQLVLFDWSNNTGAIGVKMDGSVLEEKIVF